MLRIDDITNPPQVETKHTFPLDPFQKCAISAIQNRENVLVTAKTGSGKTLVGEYQIEYSLERGKRVFYTTPIKSLSNQKFHDLKQMYPSVGIMTGDIKFMPQASVVIMTTEILRNLLYKIGSSTQHLGSTADLSLDDVDAIVFDEVHYFNDPQRGKVWEECLVLLPPDIRLVLLSATIDSPAVFAEWIGEMKQVPMHLISTEYRVVPLIHRVQDNIVMDEKNRFYKEVYSHYLRYLKKLDDQSLKHTEAVKARGEDDPVVVREARQSGFLHHMNQTIDDLNTKGLLPAMFFVFSRKNCEAYASKVTANLIDSSDGATIKHIVKFHLSRYEDIEKLPQYHTLFNLLQKGVAFHHSGLLPVLKEIVEMLFARGFIKVLFATETFAVGINMPTKTVVFTSYRKFDDEKGDLRMLRTDEYIQMAGRAGRRGKDTQGLVLYLPDRKPESLEDVERMMTGKQQSLSSKMEFHYDFLLKCLHHGTEWKSVVEKSYWNEERLREIHDLETEIKELNKPFGDLEIEHYALRESYEIRIKNTQNAERKLAQSLLDTWKNKHMGPKWEAGWKKFKEYRLAQTKADNLQVKVDRLKKVEVPFLENLQKFGFVDEDGKITELGVLASEINEGHPLIMSVLFQKGVSLSRNELIALLSCFVEGETDEVIFIHSLRVPQTLRQVVNEVHKIAGDMFIEEIVKSEAQYWKVHNYWIEIVYRWMQGEEMSILCAQYELYEGNFMKAILKVANIVDEWVTMATYTKNLEILETLREFRTELVRGLVIPDSLYLRL